jgi:hypothetical protein
LPRHPAVAYLFLVRQELSFMDQESLQKQIRAVKERMIAAGWLDQLAHGHGITASHLTDQGKTAVRLWQGFLAQGEISAADMACFLALIKTIPPETLED